MKKNASPARACGIDFGTSNSTVGWLRPGMETLIALEDDKITLPSVVFFSISRNVARCMAAWPCTNTWKATKAG
nr:hypothetical protein GCM10020185_23640 [Pseudomonas brassicacearum subsp. brassicacearum]